MRACRHADTGRPPPAPKAPAHTSPGTRGRGPKGGAGLWRRAAQLLMYGPKKLYKCIGVLMSVAQGGDGAGDARHVLVAAGLREKGWWGW